MSAPGTPETYDVVLLVEEALSAADAAQVVSLHEAVELPVRHHVLLPVEDAAARVEAAMGTLASGEVMASPAMVLGEVDLEAVRREARERSEDELARTLEALRAAGGEAVGRCVVEHPVDALRAVCDEVGAEEAIVLTRPHVVAEFFHVDWASQARRHLGIPVLHLLEHETFDEQAGGGEGVSGL